MHSAYKPVSGMTCYIMINAALTAGHPTEVKSWRWIKQHRKISGIFSVPLGMETQQPAADNFK